MAYCSQYMGVPMLKKLLLAGAFSLPFCTESYADAYGQSIIPTGTTTQASATGTSAAVTLSSTSGGYVLVWNEGSVFAYVTCNASIATLPGTAGPNSTPVGPSGGVLLYKPVDQLTCAAITAGTAATVDFTPVTLF